MSYQKGDIVLFCLGNNTKSEMVESVIIEAIEYDWDAVVYRVHIQPEWHKLLDDVNETEALLWDDQIVGYKTSLDTREVW